MLFVLVMHYAGSGLVTFHYPGAHCELYDDLLVERLEAVKLVRTAVYHGICLYYEVRFSIVRGAFLTVFCRFPTVFSRRGTVHDQTSTIVTSLGVLCELAVVLPGNTYCPLLAIQVGGQQAGRDSTCSRVLLDSDIVVDKLSVCECRSRPCCYAPVRFLLW